MAPAPVSERKKDGLQELDRRKYVGLNSETVINVGATDFPGHYPHEDHAWDKSKFKDKFEVQFHQNEPYESSFSLIGIDASVANAFRRIMIAEIPSVAIEYCFVYNNTSVIQDEVLCQRIGLVPFKGGKQGLLEFMKWYKKPAEGSTEEPPTPYDYNTILMELKVECTRNKDAAKGETDPHKAYHNAHVYAKHIKFKPYGRQLEYFSDENVIAPTNPEILLAKLRPGQVIDIEMHAIKGVGADHAKFSPVATASYRLLPVIDIQFPILGNDAHKFEKCFPDGVIKLDQVTEQDAAENEQYAGHVGETKAVVANAMKDTVSRECLRHPEFSSKVKLGRVRDHFIFNVESVGQWNSDELFLESVNMLRAKCEAFKRNIASMTL